MTRPAMARFDRIILALFAILLVAMPVIISPLSPARAQVEIGPDTTVSDDPEPVITTETTTPTDDAIAERIAGIFGEIDGLNAVEIAVEEGVVQLTGPIADQADADRAQSIAQRVSGVVTVEADFERDLSVDSNVEPVVDNITQSIDGLISALPLIGIALVIAFAIGLFGHFIAASMRLWRRIAPNIFLAELLSTSVRVLFIGLGIFIALDILGATAVLGAVLGGAGVIGLAVGFALRDTVDNYVSSVMLSIRQPFRANDHVLIGDREGRVVRLTSRATIMMTLDGNHLRIPNATVFKAEILNFTRNPQRRFTFELGVDADDDPAAAVKTGLAAINGQAFTLNDPEATAEIREVGDSNIIIAFHGWVDQRETDFKKARGAAIRATKNALEEAGFALPEPIYRLRFDGNLLDANLLAAMGQDGATAAAESPEKAPLEPARKTAVSDDDIDVSPEAHVENLVDGERSSQTEDDLLSNDQPVE